MTPHWSEWQCTPGVLLMRPEHDYEGADEPIKTSYPGVAYSRVHELRDPAIYEEDGHVYILYTVAGEQGIAMAELVWEP